MLLLRILLYPAGMDLSFKEDALKTLARAVEADVGRKIVQLSLTGCQNFI